MSVMAAGQVTMKMKRKVPEAIVGLVKQKKYIDLTFNNMDYVAEFDGNWRLDDVIDAVELLNPYIESGDISYWSDEGEARAYFYDGEWYEEWQEHYYVSDLPTIDISSTSRINEILNIIANDIMACSDSKPVIDLLFRKCNLSDAEIKLYGLGWLKELDKEGNMDEG